MLEPNKHVLKVVGDMDLVDWILTELDFSVLNCVFEVLDFDQVQGVLCPEEFSGFGAHEDCFEGGVDFDGCDLLTYGDGFLEFELPTDFIEFL